MSAPSRFDRYDEDVLEYLALKKRAEGTGRTPTEQYEWEEDQAAKVRAQVAKEVAAENVERRRRSGGHSFVNPDERHRRPGAR